MVVILVPATSTDISPKFEAALTALNVIGLSLSSVCSASTNVLVNRKAVC